MKIRETYISLKIELIFEMHLITLDLPLKSNINLPLF